MTTLFLRAIATVRTWLGLNDPSESRQLQLALAPVRVPTAPSRRA
jgi:hypothetical protein